MFGGEIGILRFELPDLSLGAPLPKGVASVSHVGPGDAVEPSRPVEAPGRVESESLGVDETVVARRANGLLVELYRVGLTSLDSRDLGGHQGSPVREVLGACTGTGVEPPAVCRQRREMRRAFA